MRNFVNQFLRHSLVGGTAFAIDYGLMIALTENAGFYYLWSAIISFVVSMLFNYCFSMRFVFQRRTDISRQLVFLIFTTLSSIGLAMNTVLLWYLVTLTNMHYQPAKLIATLVVTLYNFFSRKRYLEEKQIFNEAI
ncbi:Putative flippase GtrA (transmembrane translocase of bactoprenol-linked glucose) [Lachnospiraceae bacterium XBB1006]|nr:Putative flippase GtrA (transmembrane translocase of bactoprenol-linked glucose) [Lachnospiraceae bacterium XBB1006]